MVRYLLKHWKLIVMTVLCTVGTVVLAVVAPFYVYLPQIRELYQELREEKRKPFEEHIERGEYMAEEDVRITRAFYLENYERAEELLREIIATGEASPGAYMAMYRAIRTQIFSIDDQEIRENKYNEALGYLKRGMEKYPEAEALSEEYRRAKEVKRWLVNGD